MSPRTHILLRFTAAIGAPSVVLMVLAVRGVENDQARLEKRAREDHAALAEKISTEVRDSIDIIADRALSPYDTGTDSAFAGPLAPLARAPRGIEQLFRFDRRLGTVDFAPGTVLYGSAYRATDEEPESPPDDDPGPGEDKEFRRRDLRGALVEYENTYATASGRRQSARLLASIGRLQGKLGHHHQAIRTLQALLSRYSDVCPYGPTPIAPSATIALAAQLVETGDIRQAVALYDSLYRALLSSVWPLEIGPFDFFAYRCTSDVRTLLRALPRDGYSAVAQGRLDSMILEEKSLRIRTERLHLLRQQLPWFLKTSPSHVDAPAGATRHNAVLEHDSCLYQISTNAVRGRGQCEGVVIDTGYIHAEVLPAIMHRNLSESGIAWTVVDRRGRVVATSGSVPAAGGVVQHTLPDGYPPWTIQLSLASQGLLQVLISPEKSLYGIIVLLAFIILVFGSLSTVRLLAHELDLAQMKSDFVSTVSHEFKSPLTAIRQLAEMLQSGRVPSETKRRQYYDVIVEQSERVTVLIDNILDFAKMEEGKKIYSFERTDIVALLREIVQRVQHQFLPTGKKIRVSIPEQLPLLSVDRISFSQAVTNILDNAMKYSGEAEFVEVGAAQEGSEVVISVKDYGYGISREDITKIFERFYRGRSQHTRTTKGSGLGLTLVQHIVNAHRGTVSVESAPGKGSTFTLHFPVPAGQEGHRGSGGSDAT